MLDDVCGLLVCPVCGAGFTLTESARTGPVLRCATGHSFDVARQGYVNLMPGGARPGTADTAEMVAARAAFLDAGHYAPLARALAGLASGVPAGTPDGAGRPVVLDAGAGTGYYLAAVLGALPSTGGASAGNCTQTRAVGLAMDISARALRRAARAAPGIGAVGWDTWQPFPVRSAAVSLILNVFAPRNGPEFRRVLRPGGALIVATPAEGHLAELIGAAGLLTVDERKGSRLAATLGPYFTMTSRQQLTVPLRLTRAEAATLIAMGPSAWHTDPAGIRTRLAAMPEPIPVTAAFDVARYQAS
jgi:23S rRNA (guanine745-N1)-methyltransferase